MQRVPPRSNKETGNERNAMSEVGKVTLFVDSREVHEAVQQVDRIPDVCSCGEDLYHGFGLLGGGYGPYAVCDECGAVYKTPIPDDED